MGVLDKKVSEFMKDENGFIDIPLDDDVVGKIRWMVKRFDASEFGAFGPETKVKYLFIDTNDWSAEACVDIIGEQCTITPRSRGDRWDPPDADIDTERFDEVFNFYADGIKEDMTIEEVIDEIGDQSEADDRLVRELYELTRDMMDGE